MTSATVLRSLAWILLAGLIFVTLSPINLRPISPLPTQVERAAALAIIGFVFAIAYPRHLPTIAIVVLGSTIALELLQLATPSRHGRVLDALVKLSGGAFGLVLGWIWSRWSARR